MNLLYYQIDAFSWGAFTGNPAGVCPLEEWLSDDILQAIAQENNQAETAFFVDKGFGHYELRWFTPEVEVDLCGHATLAAAFVLFEHLGTPHEVLRFASKGGELVVKKLENGALEMDFPAVPASPTEMPEDVEQVLGIRPKAGLLSTDLVLLFETAEQVYNLDPDLFSLELWPGRGVICTAPGSPIEGDAETDFCSRFFAPKVGIDEDHATGSAHCVLAPYWAEQFGKSVLNAYQASARGAWMQCEINATQLDRVLLRGECHSYLEGVINIGAQ